MRSGRITRRKRIAVYIAFSIIWLLSFLTLIQFTTKNGLNTLSNKPFIAKTAFTSAKNQLGALCYQQFETQENARAIVSLNFKSLAVENNELAIFKTALHRTVKIRDLMLKFYQYGGGRTDATSNSTVKEYSQPDLQTIIDSAKKIYTGKDCWRLNIDLSNISEINVNGFNYKVFRDGDLFLSIQSKRAIASYSFSGLVLRGYARIETARGNTLVSNCVNWDIKKGLFKVDGVYVLNSGGKQIAGRNICVDTQLRVCENNHSDKKEEQKCYTKKF